MSELLNPNVAGTNLGMVEQMRRRDPIAPTHMGTSTTTVTAVTCQSMQPVMGSSPSGLGLSRGWGDPTLFYSDTFYLLDFPGDVWFE